MQTRIDQFCKRKQAENLNPENGGNSFREAFAEEVPNTFHSQAPISDLGSAGPSQPKNIAFPSKISGDCKRSFRAEWYKSHPWIEYSVQADAVFCYPCRNFHTSNTDPSFTTIGFSKWKRALESDRGFQKHEKSESHLTASEQWKEREKRQQESTTIGGLLFDKAIKRNRYYVKSIIETIIFLAANQLSFRGNYDRENHEENGLFNNLFKFAIQRDIKLAEIHSHIPENSKYTSPELQNEIIQELAIEIKQSIQYSIKKAVGYSILADSTRDKENHEQLAIGIRFIGEESIPVERCIEIKTLPAADAQTIANAILSTLNSQDLDLKYLLSQAYDGAAVMAGIHGGVQRIISNTCGRDIPYLHCFAHQLHLVVMAVSGSHARVKNFFALCEHLYCFFRKLSVQAIYEGHSLKRMLPQRWIGHFSCVQVICNNFQEIRNALMSIQMQNTGDSFEARGLISCINNAEFTFLQQAFLEILSILKILNNYFEKTNTNLVDSIRFLNAISKSIEVLRSTDSFERIFSRSSGVLNSSSNEELNEHSEPATKRQHKLPEKLSESFTVLYGESMSLFSNRAASFAPESSRVSTIKANLKEIYYEVIDLILSDFKKRFQERNIKIFLASSAILRKSSRTTENLSPLLELLSNLPSDNLSAELHVLHNGVLGNYNSLQALTDDFQSTSAAFPIFQSILDIIRSLPISTTRIETCFSKLTSILRPQRYSMSTQRLSALVLLSFNRDLLENLDISQFIDKFASKRPRRLQLL